MQGFELLDISKRVSKELTLWNPPYNKIKKVRFRRIFEMARTTVPMNSTKFWADDTKHKTVSKVDKDKFFLRYHRTTDIYGHVFAFAHAIKSLCDKGITMFHIGAKVVDFLVLTNSEFEIGDIYWENSFVLVDPISGKSITSLPSHENMQVLRHYPLEVCKRLGIIPPKEEQGKGRPKIASPPSYRRSMPHLWIAAILEEDESKGGKCRSMVHIDVCAAAYDDEGYMDYNGSPVSLKIFETPEYQIMATSNLQRAIRYEAFDEPKLLLLPFVHSTDGLCQFGMLNTLPESFRHFRCFERLDSSHIEVTPLDSFVDQGYHFPTAEIGKWLTFVNKLRLELIGSIPAGANVILYDYEQKPEWNGKTFRIQKAMTDIAKTSKKKRVPLFVPGHDQPISVSVHCLRITNEKMYTTLDDFVKKTERTSSIFSTVEDDRRQITSEITEEVKYEIETEPQVACLMSMLTVGKPNILTYANDFYLLGLKKLLTGPIRHILSKPMLQNMTQVLHVVESNKAEDALNILKLIKNGKLKLREKEPLSLLVDGSVAKDKGAEFHQLMNIVQEKIASDAGLKSVFDLMARYNIFPALPWN